MLFVEPDCETSLVTVTTGARTLAVRLIVDVCPFVKVWVSVPLVTEILPIAVSRVFSCVCTLEVTVSMKLIVAALSAMFLELLIKEPPANLLY